MLCQTTEIKTAVKNTTKQTRCICRLLIFVELVFVLCSVIGISIFPHIHPVNAVTEVKIVDVLK